MPEHELLIRLDWKELELDISQFIYGWGGDNVLNLANVKQIEFGISRSPRGGGSGYLDVDEVKYKTGKIENFIISQYKRLFGFPKDIVKKIKLNRDNRVILKEIASDTWKYFKNMSNKF